MALVATVVVFQLTPLYTADAQVMLNNRRVKVADMENVTSGLNLDAQTVLSERELIQSSEMIRRLVQKLNLVSDPEFNPEIRSETFWSKLGSAESYLPAGLANSMGLASSNGELSMEYLEGVTIKNVRRVLDVSPVGRSYVLQISITTTSPKKSALMANTLAEFYIDDQLESKFQTAQRATNWLNQRLAELREKVRESESLVQAFLAENLMREGGSSETTSQQVSELNTQLIGAKAKRAEAEARLDQVQRLARGQGDISSAAEVLNSPLIQRLREQESQVLRKVSEMANRYQEQHPAMITAQAELQDLRKSILSEVKKIAQAQEHELQVARTRENAIQDGLTRLERKSSVQNKNSIKLKELEREAAANRMLYENFLGRFKETSEQQNFQQADARMISRAEVPVIPSFPKKKNTLALSAFGGLLLGIILALVLEHLDNAFRSPTQVEERTGIPAIGMVPLVPGKDRAETAIHLIQKPSSAAAEAVRSIRTGLTLSDVDKPPKLVCLTSSVPGEGKTNTSIWLAQVTAMSGQKVLLIDADLRRPQIQKSLKIEGKGSLVDLLSEQRKWDEVVYVDPKTGLNVICGRSPKINALDLLSSAHMQAFLKEVRHRYDLVVVDTPPVMAVADSKVLGQIAEKTLFVVQWNATPRDVVQASLKALADAGVSLAGVVLTKVDMKKNAQYGYGDSGYYYGKYKQYYTE